MADSDISVFDTTATAKNVDVRTESTNSNLRQVVVLGDPSVNDNVVSVVTADPGASSVLPGLVVRLAGSATVVGTLTGITGSVGVYFDRGNPTVTALLKDGTGTNLTTTSNNLDVNVKSIGTSGTTAATNSGVVGAGVQRIVHATDVASSVQIVAGSASIGVLGTNSGTDIGDVTINNASGASAVNIQDGGNAITVDGTLTGITGSVAVYFDRGNPTVTEVSAATIATNTGNTATAVQIMDDWDESDRAKVNPVVGQAGVAAGSGVVGVTTQRVVLVTDVAGSMNIVAQGLAALNLGGTASIFAVSGSTSTVGNNTLVSPSAAYSFKVYAYSIQTTGAVSIAPRFTTGASAGATELWRPLVTASGVTGVQGANLATAPNAPIFATGTSTTLSLYLDAATLVHYSLAYTKESA